MRCPCAKKSETRTFAACCEPYLSGQRPAPTAEALMRSRYSAFVRRDAAYLLATWHASRRPASLDFTPGQEWIGLQIVATRETGETATVEFNARSRIGGSAHVLHEVSNFVHQNGRWYYVDGLIKE